MLMAGFYPYPLKRRIDSACGHLSNLDCAAFLPELVQSGTTQIVLGHLSRENNLPSLALETSVSSLMQAGMPVSYTHLMSTIHMEHSFKRFLIQKRRNQAKTYISYSE